MWMARRELLVGGERRQPGDPVPEAEGWQNRQFYVNLGWIERVEDAPDAREAQPGADAPAAPDPPDSAREAAARRQVTLAGPGVGHGTRRLRSRPGGRR